VIEAQDLTKRYGDKLAVDHLTFRVEPGRVTGFLRPNGAGKSTTMRLVLGLDRPAAGRATINGRPYVEVARPLRTVGALLEARAMHPGAAPVTTCCSSPRPRACPAAGWTRCWTWSG
jgi:ABC-2 type transport system ATP-binding protein